MACPLGETPIRLSHSGDFLRDYGALFYEMSFSVLIHDRYFSEICIREE